MRGNGLVSVTNVIVSHPVDLPIDAQPFLYI